MWSLPESIVARQVVSALLTRFILGQSNFSLLWELKTREFVPSGLEQIAGLRLIPSCSQRAGFALDRVI
jgi:hypothetical protein